jgi:hypothetical protein
VECRICGTTVDPRRVELGYDYCTADECQRLCLEPARIVRVAVNKAADQFARAEDVVPQGEIGQNRIDDGAPYLPPAPVDQPEPPSPRPTKSTLEKLRDAEKELDRELMESYERFSRSEITAAEMSKERDALIREYNRKVMAENIRYRGMLRRRRPA